MMRKPYPRIIGAFVFYFWMLLCSGLTIATWHRTRIGGWTGYEAVGTLPPRVIVDVLHQSTIFTTTSFVVIILIWRLNAFFSFFDDSNISSIK